MRLLPDGTLRFSPQDLNAYLEGDFAAWCDRNAVEQQRQRGRPRLGSLPFERDVDDEETALLKRRGLEHEAAHLAALQRDNPDIVVIERDERAFDTTLAAMRAGAPVIFQAELRAEPWMGIADFLHRVPGPSLLGDYHYEPQDTKLASTAHPEYLLQLCTYAAMLEAMQGVRPASFAFVLGDGRSDRYRTVDFWDYYRRIRRSFERFQQRWSVDAIADPGRDRRHGRWSTTAQRHLEEIDDLSLVADISRAQIVRLRAAGIDTAARLASSDSPVAKMNPTTLHNLRMQARLQVDTRNRGAICWDYRPADPERPRRGLAVLPPPSPGDAFFDIEGFPYAADGLEYLLGVVTVTNDGTAFTDWWAHDEAQEKRAFEQFMDWVYARWKAEPTMHIYHYAAYEQTALTRLMGKYATREFEVDQLLRHRVLVDLYSVVRQGMVIGTPSYSLKEIERLYMPARTEGVTSAGGSVVEYQKWIDSGESQDHAESRILTRIREYNRVDCESTVKLRDWLLLRQAEAGVAWIAPERGPESSEEREGSPAEILSKQLLGLADGEAEASEARRVTRLLAFVLEFHRREDKPCWWKYFERIDASDEELFEDSDCLAGLVRTARPAWPIKRSTGLEYRFDADQETRLHAGQACVIAGTDGRTANLEQIDCNAGLAAFKVGPRKTLPGRMSLIPPKPIQNEVLRNAIMRFVLGWMIDPRKHPAVDDLLHRRAPGLLGEALHIDEARDLVPQAIDAVRRLDRSTLCIQGPPGTGKTSLAAELVLALLAGGKRVGIVANSHSVTLNLLDRICCRAEELGLAPTLVKVGEGESRFIDGGRIRRIASGAAAAVIAEGALAIAGTSWLFAREDLVNSLDYLFIEEAGQFSLANAVAVGSAAANLVLLGDQMQLAQPLQGTHPGESGLSVLDYLLQGHATVPPELGIFLGRSWRMHPDVCRLVSEAYYEGRLHSAPATRENRVIGGARTSIGLDAGVRYVPVEHEGSTQASEEEVECIAKLVAELLGCEAQVKGEPARPMTLADILIVAPFNMQVRALSARLGRGARVGSVDRFQGQEAAVVIVSMCASTLDDAPRGPAFLLSPNRLNVAISRAQALAIVVGSPLLGDVRARSVAEMRLLNGWCRVERCGTGVR